MAAQPPQANVILIDNSLSMQYRDQETSRLQRAKTLASNVLQTLRDQDRAIVLPLLPDTPSTEPPGTSPQPESAPHILSQSRETWEADLAAIAPNHAGARSPTCLPTGIEPLARKLGATSTPGHSLRFHHTRLGILSPFTL